jgi:hypothetical protein
MEQIICEVWSGVIDNVHICADILNVSYALFIGARNFMLISRIQQNQLTKSVVICIYFVNLHTFHELVDSFLTWNLQVVEY